MPAFGPQSLNRTRRDGKPNINELSLILQDMDSLRLTVKYFGYELARTLAAALPPRERGTPRHVGLGSKPSTQTDIASDWVAHWCAELQIPVVFHRKLWELAYVLQAIHDHGSLRPGARGLGFGCGTEPLPSYLAAHAVEIMMTDLAPELGKSKGWIDTNQHTGSRDLAFQPHLVSREAFDQHVTLRYVDMNAIDPTLQDFDFCWSICALEHLGSIKQGLDFIRNSLDTVRPGGLSVHTTEFNFANDAETIDNWPTVLFQRRHFIEIARRLQQEGHTVAPLDFNIGNLPLDRFIDVAPYSWQLSETETESWGVEQPHIKLTIDGFASTCFGLVITKAR